MDVRGLLSNLDIHAAPLGHRHARPGWINIDCPFCAPGSGKYHLGIAQTNLTCSCWRCGVHPLPSVLAAYTGRPASQFKHLYRGLDPTKMEVKRHEGTFKIPPGVEPMKKPHRQYLRRRGFDPKEIAKRWGVQGIGATKKLRWRLWIPLHRRGKLVSWTTRTIQKGVDRRYVNAKPTEESYPSGGILYGAQHARNAILITEGPTDVWRFGPGAVCTLGLQFSPSQVEEMLRYPIRAVCFDRSELAQQRARHLCKQLKDFPGQTIHIELESGEDLDTADPEELAEIHEALAI